MNDCILGNPALHEHFATYADVLGHIVQRTPRPTTLLHLESVSSHAPNVLRRCCNDLARDGILIKETGTPTAWKLAKALSEVTLEDVFRCAIASLRSRSGKNSKSGGVALSVEIFLMQAMLTVDDHVYRHLRTFSLDRLKSSGS